MTKKVKTKRSSQKRRMAKLDASLKSAYELAAKNLALTKFPEEDWIRVNGVQLSKIRKKQSEKSKNPDAIIDGLIYDFKQVKFVILGSDVRRFDFDEI